MRRTRRSTWGAVLVEATIALPVLLLFLAFGVDACIFMHHYLRLTYATEDMTRVASVRVGEAANRHSDALSCAEIKSWADTEIGKYPPPIPNSTVRLKRVRKDPLLPYVLIGIEGEWRGACVCCWFFRNLLRPTVLSTMVLEDDKRISDINPLTNECSL